MFKKIFASKELRRKIFFTFLVIVIFRFLTRIPVPGVDVSAIRAFVESSTLFGLFDLFSGGGLQNFSIVTLGLGPYINSSIIMQLFTTMIPQLEELSKEGESGREKINQYTKLLSIPISLAQAYGVYFLLGRQTTPTGASLINTLNGVDLIVLILTLTAGGILLVWLGDMVTEYGIGNGVSILIFIGIISRLPASVLTLFANMQVVGITIASIINLFAYLIVSLVVIIGVVLVNEGTRKIILHYGRRGTTSQKVENYLPIKVNQAGVIPIIFAISVVLLPSVISGPLSASTNPKIYPIGIFLARNFSQNSFGYNAFYFLLVIGFTFFYTFVQFNPEKIADDIKKRGGFIPGIRPGSATKDFLNKVVIRLTLFGSVFLGLIAILPFIIQIFGGSTNMAIGGTGLLIVVSVVLETISQLESQVVTRSYDAYLS